MRTTIVCGLLGAGKTSFIQQFVRRTEEKVVVLVNDFGRAGIDGEIFSADGIETIELPSGCVCCTLKFDLIRSIEKIIANFSPDHLLIEPSGVASPSGVLEALDVLGIRPVSVVGVIDATEFLELHDAQMYGSFFEDQVVNSDVILVNKVDLAGEERIAGTMRVLERMNPRAILFPTVKAVLKEDLPALDRSGRFETRQDVHFDFDTISFSLDGAVEFLRFKRFIDSLAGGAFGDVVRAKALVETDRGPYRFDLTFGKVEMASFGNPVSGSRVVVIGRNLKKDALTKLELVGRKVVPNVSDDGVGI